MYRHWLYRSSNEHIHHVAFRWLLSAPEPVMPHDAAVLETMVDQDEFLRFGLALAVVENFC